MLLGLTGTIWVLIVLVEVLVYRVLRLMNKGWFQSGFLTTLESNVSSIYRGNQALLSSSGRPSRPWFKNYGGLNWGVYNYIYTVGT